jgi:mitotic spindle assembly checkpoint protein MAD2
MFARAIKEKSDKEIMREIQAIMRQIASCITYLPCLDEPCKNRNRHPPINPRLF